MNMIKRLRVNKEMTQEQLAKACGVSQGTIAGWERGTFFPRTEKIVAIAKALDCKSDLLLQMADEKRRQAEDRTA